MDARDATCGGLFCLSGGDLLRGSVGAGDTVLCGRASSRACAYVCNKIRSYIRGTHSVSNDPLVPSTALKQGALTGDRFENGADGALPLHEA